MASVTCKCIMTKSISRKSCSAAIRHTSDSTCKTPSKKNKCDKKYSFKAFYRTSGHVRPAKIQISLCIRAVWSEASLGTFWIAKGAKFLHAGTEDSGQPAWTRRLIWVFVGRTCEKVRFCTLRLISWTAPCNPFWQHFVSTNHSWQMVSALGGLKGRMFDSCRIIMPSVVLLF